MYYTYAYCDPSKPSELLRDFGCDFLPFYIGYGKGNRHLSHLSSYRIPSLIKSNPIKCAKIRKLVEAGEIPIIKILKRFESKHDAIQHELELISKLGTIANVLGIEQRGPLANLHKGGHGGHIPKSPEVRKAMSDKMKGRVISEETRRKISVSKTGNTHHSPETRARISTQTSKALLDPHIRKKISDTHLGKSKTLEHRNKLADHLTRVNQDPVMHAKKTATKRANGTLQHSERTKQKISKTTAKAMSAPEVIERLKVSSKKRWANPEERKKIADKNARTFELTNKQTGESFVITNLAQYCRDHSTNLHRVSREFVVTKMSRGV